MSITPDVFVPSPELRVAILQSNYIPWRGYFDIIHDVDLFVFYDDVQYTKSDWRTRNRVKTKQGSQWLTIPVNGSHSLRICDVEFADPRWQVNHWRTLSQTYAKAPYFAHYQEAFEDLYLGRKWTLLSEFNQAVIRRIAADLLGVTTRFADSRDYHAQGAKRERIMDLLSKIGARSYVSGPAAKDYLDPQEFVAKGIELIWKEYPEYPEYPQFHPPFDPFVTILDLLFHVGPDAPHYIWDRRSGRA